MWRKDATLSPPVTPGFTNRWSGQSVCPLSASVKPTLVTGATGFVGWHVARALLERGDPVRALARDPAKLRELSGVQGVQGDLRDPASLERAVEGCGVVFHVAADYRLWTREPEEMYRSNVEGTRAMLEAARRAGVERFVYTSTVGCIGVSRRRHRRRA